ncbi:uncharacterized protein BT62DRAFT_992484 [Guyanagaster necrorhizus]|uniref:UBL3-like ubiquitin domain-containing protein n=1 Tax=Guyanagaster necrorhizus TaxID=856835 RepID=A0A9P7VX77_9AGAR|nr:uncharacterized protein BT62DRAFT_992484 [Guyanagaster necrorhizus MCA 3950]KAG7448390.1 hypothetical protein BT62DRAFT_992484 [Guyanagaster necrorhizus MCA 3950]
MPRPKTAVSRPHPTVTFDEPEHTLMRVRSEGYMGPALGVNVYSTNASARTSYTRVDLAVEGDGTGWVGEEGRSSRIWNDDFEDDEEGEKRDVEGEDGDEDQGGEADTEGGDVGDDEKDAGDDDDELPNISLTFLLLSGKRRTVSFNPEVTVRRVKELMWNAWPHDWSPESPRPPAPSYLRILHLGKIWQDDDVLQVLSFYLAEPSWTAHNLPINTPPTSATDPNIPKPPPTIVHLSIRPYTAEDAADEALRKNGVGLCVRLGKGIDWVRQRRLRRATRRQEQEQEQGREQQQEQQEQEHGREGERELANTEAEEQLSLALVKPPNNQ